MSETALGQLRDLQSWMATGGLYPSRETLKRGIERMLLSLGDPRWLGNPHALSLTQAAIYYARGDERLPIFLGEGSGDHAATSGYIRVQVGWAPQDRAILEELAYLELSGAEPSEICQNLALTLEWARRHWDAYQAEVRELLAERLGGVSVEQLILLAWRLAGSLQAGAYWVDGELEPNEEGHEQVTPWSATQHPQCYRAGKALAEWNERIRRLFVGAFTLRDTLLDLQRYESSAAALDIEHTIRIIAGLKVEAQRTLPFKVRPGGNSLHELLTRLQRYARAMMELDVEGALRADREDIASREAELHLEQGADRTRLHQQLIALRWRCGEVGVVWREGWTQALEVMVAVKEEEIEALRVEITTLREEAEKLMVNNGQVSSALRYAALRRRMQGTLKHRYWEALEAVRVIQDELLRAGRRRYRRDGRQLTGVEAYRVMLQTLRAAYKELGDG